MTAAEASTARDARAVTLVVIGAAGLAATAITAWACARSSILVEPATTAVWRGAFVASYVAVGIFTWWRRPENRLGPLLAGVGFSYSIASLNASAASLPYTIGMVVWAGVIVYLAYVYLCFPRGRLESSLERAFVSGLVVTTAAVWAALLVISPKLPVGGSFNDCGTRCPANALQVLSGYAGTGAALRTTFNIVFTISLIGIAMLIFNRARSSARRRRRQLTPLAMVFIASIAEFVIALFVAPAYPGARGALRIADGVLTVAVPAAILVGQIRGDRFAAITLGRIAVRSSGRTMTPVAAQQMLRDGVGDPTLTLALWDPERAEYVDAEGVPVDIPRDPRGRAVTRVIRDDWPVAALIHDPTMDVSAEVIEGLAATSLMLLDNARLVEELRSSRSRIVETADRERRRLEQDLHDGAQQRLVTVQVRLGLAREAAESDELKYHLDAAQREAQAALEELRAVAHGIYPQTLRDLGLAPALRSLATSCTNQVRVIDRGVGRLSAPVEGAIYFCIRESIQNASKHAGQDAVVTATLVRREDVAEFTVSDDGAGMAPDVPPAGMGIRGMRDRIEAVGGEFEITSLPGRGTSVHGTITIAPSRRARGA